MFVVITIQIIYEKVMLLIIKSLLIHISFERCYKTVIPFQLPIIIFEVKWRKMKGDVVRSSTFSHPI